MLKFGQNFEIPTKIFFLAGLIYEKPLKKGEMKRNWKLPVLSLVAGFMLLSLLNVQAQDEEPLTDEELKKYALVMDYAEQEKERLKTDYNELIQAEELMDGGRRFKELNAAGGDEAKLAEIEATPEEIEVFNKIVAANNDNIAAFKEAYTAKIKDSEQLGAGLYNRITKELKSDEELKSRYEAILETVQNDRMAAEEEMEDAEASTDSE
jgi:uncharacterized protein YktA (UPF0223 family)